MEEKRRAKDISGWYAKERMSEADRQERAAWIEAWYEKKGSLNYRTVPVEVPGRMLAPPWAAWPWTPDRGFRSSSRGFWRTTWRRRASGGSDCTLRSRAPVFPAADGSGSRRII